MLDIKFIRENIDLVKAGARKKHIEIDLDRLLVVDEKRRALIQEVEGARAKQNEANDKITAATPDERTRLIEEMRTLKESFAAKEKELEEVTKEWQLLMVQVPNVPDPTVPDGDSDAENVEVKVWGGKPQFNFEPKSHIDLMLNLDMADFERGTKVAGFRGYFLKNQGAMLSFAIWRYAQDFFLGKDFTPMIVPSLVKRVAFLGTGYLPQGEDDLYKTQDGDFLAGTAEVATICHNNIWTERS
jgi:seryl-tRNA synthetase